MATANVEETRPRNVVNSLVLGIVSPSPHILLTSSTVLEGGVVLGSGLGGFQV